MKTVTTASGFTIEIDEACLDDMELFEQLIDVQNRRLGVLPSVVDRILGDKKNALYEHLRGENGIVPMTAVLKEVLEIVNLAGGKNS